MKTIRLSLIIFFVAIVIGVIGQTNSQAELTVYDADGQLLGVLTDKGTSEVVNVFLQSLDVIAGINIGTGVLKSNTKSPLYYNSFDCTGDPYITPMASYYVIGNGDKHYMGEKSAPSTVNVNSMLMPFGTTCKLISRDYELVPAQEVILPFILPVALPLFIEHEPAHPGKWK